MHYTGMAAFEIAGIVLWDPVARRGLDRLGAVLGASRCRSAARQRQKLEDRRRRCC